jgi:hypothetical protein
MITHEIIIISVIIFLTLFYIYTQPKMEHLSDEEAIKITTDAIQNISNLYNSAGEYIISNLKVSDDTSITENMIVTKNMNVQKNINVTGSISVPQSGQNSNVLQTVFNATNGINNIGGPTKFENGIVSFSNNSPFADTINVTESLNASSIKSRNKKITFDVITTPIYQRGIGKHIDDYMCIIGGFWPATENINGACMWVDASGQWCYSAWGVALIVIVSIPRGLCNDESLYKLNASGTSR